MGPTVTGDPVEGFPVTDVVVKGTAAVVVENPRVGPSETAVVVVESSDGTIVVVVEIPVEGPSETAVVVVENPAGALVVVVEKP